MNPKEEQYLRDAEMRRARNYNHRMDSWNAFTGKDPKVNDRSFGCAIAFIVIISIGTLISAIFGWI